MSQFSCQYLKLGVQNSAKSFQIKYLGFICRQSTICLFSLDNYYNLSYNINAALGGELAVPYNLQSATAGLKADRGFGYVRSASNK